MDQYLVFVADEADLQALRRFCRLVVTHAPVEVDPDDFLHVATAIGIRTGHRIVQYKQRWSRRYLNLDHAGHAFIDAGPTQEVDWRVRRFIGCSSPMDALALLGLAGSSDGCFV